MAQPIAEEVLGFTQIVIRIEVILVKDLQDNFTASQFKTSWGSVRTEDFKREYLVMMEAFARSVAPTFRLSPSNKPLYPPR